ncbi:MAG: protoporphyrinogen oxidase [Pseudomonadota bacterium]
MKMEVQYGGVAVIGGGIAGLTAAWLLGRQGRGAVVFEQEDEAGGNIRSSRRDGYTVERGPYCFMRSSRSVWRLLRDADIEDRIVGATALATKRFVYRDGKLHAMPLDPVSFARSKLFSWETKLRLLAEPFKKGGAEENETAWDFFERRFGEEFVTYAISSFVSGVYAGDVKQLGAKAAFPKFWAFEKEYGSMIRGAMNFMLKRREEEHRAGIHPRKGLWSFQDGLGFITAWLAGRLGDSVRPSSRVRSLKKLSGGIAVQGDGGEEAFKKVILAVPPSAAAEILAQDFPEAAAIFSSIPMSPVVVVQWLPGGCGDPFPEGFGFLIPPRYRMRSLGTIFYSHIFPHMSPEKKPRLYGTFMGGAHNPNVVKLDDDELASSLRDEHGRLLGKEVPPPEVINIVRHPKAIAQLLPGHPEKIKMAKEILARHNIFPAGGFLGGVGMDHAVESAYSAVDEITGGNRS